MIHELVIESERPPREGDARSVALRREFPTVRLRGAAPSGARPIERRTRGGAPSAQPSARATTIRLEEWARPGADLFVIDERLDAERPGALVLVAGAEPWLEAAEQILTRYQWLLRRRNRASSSRLFERLLEAHLDLHDLRMPLVRADLVHALDAWQWMLRLDARASLSAQIAALFHDVERLGSEAHARVEHRARDYRAFKRAHAREGALVLRRTLAGLGVPSEIVERSAWLVEHHEEPSADRDLGLLNDADGLSFFSRNSDGFVRYFGDAHTRTKVRFTLRRLGPRARGRVAKLRLSPEVRRFLREAAEPTPAWGDE